MGPSGNGEVETIKMYLKKTYFCNIFQWSQFIWSIYGQSIIWYLVYKLNTLQQSFINSGGRGVSIIIYKPLCWAICHPSLINEWPLKLTFINRSHDWWSLTHISGWLAILLPVVIVILILVSIAIGAAGAEDGYCDLDDIQSQFAPVQGQKRTTLKKPIKGSSKKEKVKVKEKEKSDKSNCKQQWLILNICLFIEIGKWSELYFC